MRKLLLICLAINILSFLVVPVNTLKAGEGPADTLDIDADRLEVFGDQSRAVFEGGVKARQKGMDLECLMLIVYYDKTSHQILRLVAKKAVVIHWEDKVAVCSEADYLFEKELLVMTGDVLVTRGEERLSSQTIRVNMKTGHQVVEGGDKRVNIRVRSGEGGAGILKWEK
ncbi:MAG: LptA/OstA family protein [Thermodesulfobacteriota bacterium]|nr:LptA/OstA family protein [Thermodesulfobacteriota bacterium]